MNTVKRFVQIVGNFYKADVLKAINLVPFHMSFIYLLWKKNDTVFHEAKAEKK